MKRILKLLCLVVVVLAGVIVAIYAFLPWKSWLEGQIRVQLATQGLENVDFKIGSLSPSEITLTDVRMGSGVALQSLAVQYVPLDLLQGRIQDLVVVDLALEAQQTGDIWSMNGVSSTGDTKAISVPDTKEAVDNIPLDRLSLRQSHAKLATDGWSFDLPFDLTWDKPARTVKLDAADIDFRMQNFKIQAAQMESHLGFKEGVWIGPWQVDGIASEGFPDLIAKGTTVIKAQILSINGTVDAQDGSMKAEFSLKIPLADPKAMTLTISDASVTWGEGVVHIRKADIPLDGKTKTKVLLDVEKIGLQELLGMMTGQDITATGTVSGKIPVIISPDGTIGLEKSHMSANGKGLVSVPSALIPGEGAQIDLTRQVLDNFAYETLSVDVAEEEGGRVSILLGVFGNNPKVYDGRAVKLNVRLGGDVLEFLQSNIMMIMQPESILRQEAK